MSVTLTYSSLTTLSQDDDVIEFIEQSGSDPLTDPDFNIVSERKKLYCEFSVDVNPDTWKQLTLPGAKLWISWALFFPKDGALVPPFNVPSVGFSVNIPNSTYEALPIEMAWYGAPQNVRNLNCLFYLLSETTFALELEYYTTFDQQGYFSPESKSNLYRFLAEDWQTADTSIVPNSVFGTEKDLRLYLWWQQDAVTDPETFEGPIIEGQEHILFQAQASSYDTEIEFLGGNDTTVSVGELNTVIDTPMVARVYTDISSITQFYAKLIKVQDNPLLNFFENYDLQENLIADANLSYNVFKGPFLVTWNGTDNYYDLDFDIAADQLELGASYRIIIVGYDPATSQKATGISLPFGTTSVVPYCENPCPASYDYPNSLEFTATLSDTDNEYTGNDLTAVIDERIRTKLVVDYSDNKWKNNIDCRTLGSFGGDTISSNDLRKYLVGVSLEIYEEYTDTNLGGTVRNVLDQQFIQKIGTNTYQSNNIVFTFDTVAENLEMYYDFRNRASANLPCLSTTLDGAGYLPLQGNQYWGGKQLYIRWRLQFYYTDWATPFIDYLDIIQQLYVRDYSEDVQLDEVSPSSFLCPGQSYCIDASIAYGTPGNYKLINTFELIDGPGLVTESEAFVTGLLDQEQSDVFGSQDSDFTGGDARFCLDASELLLNQSYKFTAIAKHLP